MSAKEKKDHTSSAETGTDDENYDSPTSFNGGSFDIDNISLHSVPAIGGSDIETDGESSFSISSSYLSSRAKDAPDGLEKSSSLSSGEVLPFEGSECGVRRCTSVNSYDSKVSHVSVLHRLTRKSTRKDAAAGGAVGASAVGGGGADAGNLGGADGSGGADSHPHKGKIYKLLGSTYKMPFFTKKKAEPVAKAPVKPQGKPGVFLKRESIKSTTALARPTVKVDLARGGSQRQSGMRALTAGAAESARSGKVSPGSGSSTNSANSAGGEKIGAAGVGAAVASAPGENAGTLLSATRMARGNSSHKILTFTRRAARIVGDIAFGPTGEEPSKKNATAESPGKKNALKVAELRRCLRESGEQKYLQNLRFFMKYMDDSEVNDPLTYAMTRRDMWLLWYRKYLWKLWGRIKVYEGVRERIGSAGSAESAGHSHADNPRAGNSHAGDSRARADSAGFSDQFLSTLPSPEAIVGRFFQDRRIVLSLLWYLQIYTKMVRQDEILRDLVARSHKPHICVVTTNKMDTFKTRMCAQSIARILENSIIEVNLEFIDGWYVRHLTHNTQVNVVAVADRMRTLTDQNGYGQLAPALAPANPQFAQPSLSRQFFEYELGNRERSFLADYSSFTSPSAARIPLASASQTCVVVDDMSALLDSADEHSAGEGSAGSGDSLAPIIAEFKRVLKPDGTVYLQLWDIDPDSQHDAAHRKNAQDMGINEYVRYSIWRRMARYCRAKRIALPDPTAHIVGALERAGFCDVKAAFVGYPMISSSSQKYAGVDRSTKVKVPEAQMSYDVSATDLASVTGSTPESRKSSQVGAGSAGAGSAGTSASVGSDAKGMRDARLDAFFEFLASFTEFLKAVRVLDMHALTAELQRCDEIERLQAALAQKADARKQKELEKEISQLPALDPERLELAKLFIDYKFYGSNGERVKSQILTGNESAQTPGKNDMDESGRRYEGLGYFMIVTAHRCQNAQASSHAESTHAGPGHAASDSAAPDRAGHSRAGRAT